MRVPRLLWGGSLGTVTSSSLGQLLKSREAGQVLKGFVVDPTVQAFARTSGRVQTSQKTWPAWVTKHSWLISGRFRVHPCKKYMAVSISWGVLDSTFKGPLTTLIWVLPYPSIHWNKIKDSKAMFRTHIVYRVGIPLGLAEKSLRVQGRNKYLHQTMMTTLYTETLDTLQLRTSDP